MCHQAVGLIQAEIERHGITTASITLLPELTRAIQPPRALSVPFPLGYPLGAAGDARLQREVLRALLALAGESGVPVLRPLDLEGSP
jgi:D-proline reductase (dithiol) PrdB